MRITCMRGTSRCCVFFLAAHTRVQVPRDLGVRRREAELPTASGRAQRAAAEEQRQRGHGKRRRAPTRSDGFRPRRLPALARPRPRRVVPGGGWCSLSSVIGQRQRGGRQRALAGHGGAGGHPGALQRGARRPYRREPRRRAPRAAVLRLRPLAGAQTGFRRLFDGGLLPPAAAAPARPRPHSRLAPAPPPLQWRWRWQLWWSVPVPPRGAAERVARDDAGPYAADSKHHRRSRHRRRSVVASSAGEGGREVVSLSQRDQGWRRVGM
uniref:Uncharacterized protein n=1 Tax=Zea mays TaxID=4577 RepID=B7ZY46_MAIZE|nr:unknown [Zea mays]